MVVVGVCMVGGMCDGGACVGGEACMVVGRMQAWGCV